MTGKKFVHSISPTADRQERDFYRTPEWATEALLQRESFPGLVWEPACGDGAMSKVLVKYGYNVMSTDKHAHGYGESGVDFMTAKRGVIVGSVVTNPPFSIADDFVMRALNTAESKVAMLLRTLWLEGERRRERFFDGHTPLKAVYVFSKRVNVSRQDGNDYSNKSGMVSFSWFVWDKSWNSEPVVRWL